MAKSARQGKTWDDVFRGAAIDWVDSGEGRVVLLELIHANPEIRALAFRRWVDGQQIECEECGLGFEACSADADLGQPIVCRHCQASCRPQS